MRQPFCFLSALVLETILLGCQATASLENQLVYVPTPAEKESYVGLDAGLEDAWFDSTDGTRLHGWYLEYPQPKATILYLHGNAGNIGHRAEFIRNLAYQHGVRVLIFDYRGYGRSEGEPDEAGVLQDARAARAWLASRANVAEAEIVLVGQSLGGGNRRRFGSRRRARSGSYQNFHFAA